MGCMCCGREANTKIAQPNISEKLLLSGQNEQESDIPETVSNSSSEFEVEQSLRVPSPTVLEASPPISPIITGNLPDNHRQSTSPFEPISPSSDDPSSVIQKLEDETECLEIEQLDAEIETEDISQANEYIRLQKRNALDHSFISQIMDELSIQKNRCMPVSHVFRVFEEALDSKYQADLKAFEVGRQPQPISEYLLEHLKQVKGNQLLAYREISDMIPTLEKLYTDNHPYGILFCRLLQLFHQDPVPFHLGVFLVKARMQFEKLIEKANDLKRKVNLPGGRMSMGIKKPMLNKKAGFGGMAYLFDIFKLIYTLLPNDKLCRGLTMKLIKPEGMSLEEYLVFRIQYELEEKGISAEELFNQMDKDGDGSIQREELIDGIYEILKLTLTRQDGEALFQYLDVGADIQPEVFYKKFDRQQFIRHCTSEEYMSSKCKFLNVLIDVYQIIQRRDAAYFTNIYRRNSDPYMTEEKFVEILQKLKPEIIEAEQNKLLDKVIELSDHSSQITLEAFCQTMLKNNIGNRGQRDFGNFYAAIRELQDLVPTRRSSTLFKAALIMPKSFKKSRP